MKWDDKQDRIEYQGTELVNAYTVGHCWHCEAPTQWLDINFHAFLCSTECTEAKWNEYFEAATKKG